MRGPLFSGYHSVRAAGVPLVRRGNGRVAAQFLRSHKVNPILNRIMSSSSSGEGIRSSSHTAKYKPLQFKN